MDRVQLAGFIVDNPCTGERLSGEGSGTLMLVCKTVDNPLAGERTVEHFSYRLTGTTADGRRWIVTFDHSGIAGDSGNPENLNVETQASHQRVVSAGSGENFLLVAVYHETETASDNSTSFYLSRSECLG